MQRGASLFEIAIAVGVCGLLLGIVLSVINMMHAATLHNYVASIQENDSAAGTFRIKYKGLPGDFSAANAQAYGFTERYGIPGHGDGNGLIEGCEASGIRLGCENTLFWRDLSDANMLSARFSMATDKAVNGTQDGFLISTYLPPSPFRSDSQFFVYPLMGQNNYYISRITAVASDGTLTTLGALSPQDAQDLDDKMDDGSPTLGSIRSMSKIGVYEQGDKEGKPNCIDASTNPPEYNTHTGTAACQLSIRSNL